VVLRGAEARGRRDEDRPKLARRCRRGFGNPRAQEAVGVEGEVRPVLLDRAGGEDRRITFIGRFAPQSTVRAGESVEVGIQPGALMLFDPGTGGRL
jgi:hypothetical protein